MLSEKQVLTVPECSQEYDLKAYTIRRWAKQGKFLTLRSGAKILINRAVFERFLNAL